MGRDQPETVDFSGAIELAAQSVEGAGVMTILVGSLVAAVMAVHQLAREGASEDAYACLRRRIGRAILLGLELLVGADIIRTVAERPALRDVVVLALIVLIRTFLSFALELELEGRWPWQTRRT